jgi:hypothetical protein
METKPNERAQKPGKSGCCACGCGDAARDLEGAREQAAAERPEPALESGEESCCGG